MCNFLHIQLFTFCELWTKQLCCEHTLQPLTFDVWLGHGCGHEGGVSPSFHKGLSQKEGSAGEDVINWEEAIDSSRAIGKHRLALRPMHLYWHRFWQDRRVSLATTFYLCHDVRQRRGRRDESSAADGFSATWWERCQLIFVTVTRLLDMCVCDILVRLNGDIITWLVTQGNDIRWHVTVAMTQVQHGRCVCNDSYVVSHVTLIRQVRQTVIRPVHGIFPVQGVIHCHVTNVTADLGDSWHSGQVDRC